MPRRTPRTLAMLLLVVLFTPLIRQPKKMSRAVRTLQVNKRSGASVSLPLSYGE